MIHTAEELKRLQALSLDEKICIFEARILEYMRHYDNQCYVAFSGGKDSTVLLYLARKMFPDIKAVFSDTGLEYPEIREFVKTFDNVEWVKPKKNFRQVVEEYGYPVIGKEVATTVEHGRKGTQWATDRLGITDGKPNWTQYRKWEYLVNAPFKISSKCCYWLKKAPMENYHSKSKNHKIVGTMADESLLRKQTWVDNGCVNFNGKGSCSPLSIWTEQDILEFVVRYDVPYCTIYGDIVRNEKGKLETTGAKRTGCMFCMFGVHLEKEPNRFQRMAKTHPKQYDYCINSLGLGEVLDYIGVSYDPDDVEVGGIKGQMTWEDL